MATAALSGGSNCDWRQCVAKAGGIDGDGGINGDWRHYAMATAAVMATAAELSPLMATVALMATGGIDNFAAGELIRGFPPYPAAAVCVWHTAPAAVYIPPTAAQRPGGDAPGWEASTRLERSLLAR